MKYLDEYRDKEKTELLIEQIEKKVTRPWSLMEICGGQTHSIMKSGLDQLLPPEINLIHGPGCPVCVTPLELIDKAISLASMPEIIFCSYGDMLRVPGSVGNLFSVRAAGGDVRIIYSPLDALRIAKNNPEKEVIFFGIGFETTAPANAMAVFQAKTQGVENFSILVSHVTVPPAIRAILESPEVNVDGFLAAGHVCAVMGYWEYEPIAKKYQTPIVVTGFEPVDLARGILNCIQLLEEGKIGVENAYPRYVQQQGNLEAQKLIKSVFEICDRKWRGIGNIPMSGYRLNEDYEKFDAERKFSGIQEIQTNESSVCISGEILQGIKKPDECSEFGSRCTPEFPIGATMVSDEGACAAYFRYGRMKLSRTNF
ncbi:MAG: hydrogenase formation protein HypD [Chloroflexi bacterium]|jgi:hydrogenase expression/formation protein HypD|nr:hydrogenase formation protein HypD [Chloroflexota bacterium]MBT3670353.1 hydrogenase formation protein HypD [Chloroflexota bacterium]MBT4002272.1 hydrogenase formation protein HypD [Chloroflexota bacterium]MBT4305540.1 hydrogenase formation protein HypD [Chloroflexota bacterium]MBT4533152.1 hydrogenase formation protein HypD [Chloroflexota bacterium]